MNSAPRPASTPSLPALVSGAPAFRPVDARCRAAHALTPETTRSISPRSRRRRMSVKPAAASSSRRGRGLPGADLQRQRAARAQQRRRRRDQPPHQRQPVAAAVERQPRLGAHLGRQTVDVGAGDVGQVGGDDVERRQRRERRSEIAFDEGDRGAVALGVGARDRQRIRRDVAGDHLERGPRLRRPAHAGLGDRDRDRARAGAHVGDAQRARRVRESRLRVSGVPREGAGVPLTRRAHPRPRAAPAPRRPASRCRGAGPARAHRRRARCRRTPSCR